jgi:hypothetical protein
MGFKGQSIIVWDHKGTTSSLSIGFKGQTIIVWDHKGTTSSLSMGFKGNDEFPLVIIKKHKYNLPNGISKYDFRFITKH